MTDIEIANTVKLKPIMKLLQSSVSIQIRLNNTVNTRQNYR